MDVRYIKLNVTPGQHSALHDLTKELTDPVFIEYRPTNIQLIFTGSNFDINDVYNTIPSHVGIVRHKNKDHRGGGIIANSKTTIYNIKLPRKVDRDLKLALIKALRKKGGKAYIDGNDVHVDINGYKKKIMGSISFPEDGYFITKSHIETNPSYEEMRKIYDFNSPKFTKKEPFDDISEIVGGLSQINLNETFAQDVAEEFKNITEFNLIPDELTTEEKEIHDFYTEKRKTELWKYFGIEE